MLTACGNSTDVNVISPSSSRCGVAASGNNAPVPAAGGSGTLTVTTERECNWSATAESAWISLSTSTGQGPGTITYSVAANPSSSSRRGAVVVEQQRLEIAQEAAPCRYDINPQAVAISSSGENATVTVTTSGEACGWSVRNTAAWVAPDRPEGTGGGIVRFAVAANEAAEARSTTVTIADIAFTISQGAAPGPGCSYQVSPSTIAIPTGGGDATAMVAAPAGCSWSSSIGVPWISVLDGGAGTGAGAVRLRAAANDGAARSTTVLIAGQPVAVSQAASTSPPVPPSPPPPAPPPPQPTCSYAITPGKQSVGSTATTVAVEVSAPGGCAWTAVSENTWIGVTAGATGSGTGTVGLAIAANTGAQRAGRVVIGGLAFEVQQEAAPPAPCAYSIKPTYYNAGRGPDDVSIQLTTAAGCPWTVTGEPSWVTVAEGRSGSGSGTVRLVIAANAGAPRSATLAIGGESFALTQGGNCTASIKPTYYNSGRGPDEFEITVSTAAGCQWSASSPVGWAIIRSGATGSGNGVVIVRVQPNNEGPRSAVLTIAGQQFTLTQEGR